MKRCLAIVLLCAWFVCGCSANQPVDPGPPYAIDSYEEFLDTMFPAEGTEVDFRLRPVQMIGFLIMQEADDLEEFSFWYRPWMGEYSLAYWVDGVRYGVYYNLYENKKSWGLRRPVMNVQLGDENISLYQTDSFLSGAFYMGDYEVYITVKGYTNIEDVDFSHFEWVK